MSSLIEQAAARLEALRSAGVEKTGVSAHAAPAVQSAPKHGLREKHALRQNPQALPPSTKSDTSTQRSKFSTKHVDFDFDALATSGIVSPNAPRSQIADEYRVLKRPLIANALGKGAAPIEKGNLIMITSALSGEGKSFTAINLAMSMATEMDNTVMLVDADVARPSVLRMLGLPPSPGLLDVLASDSVDISEVLLRTNVGKLTLLPSGTKHERATELLASDAMSRLLDDMANRYPDRIIIFDSPPLLLTTESRVLATHMGQIVVVVKAANTSQDEVKHALSMIESCPVKMMLLNQTRSGINHNYGYGYGYGHDA